MIKHTHYRTPRNLNQAFGPYSSFTPQKKESAWWYVAAYGIAIAVVVMLLWDV